MASFFSLISGRRKTSFAEKDEIPANVPVNLDNQPSTHVSTTV